MAMRAVDTNVLLRLFVADDPAQARKARSVFDTCAGSDIELWVADIVVVELVWALDRVYQRPRDQIVQALAALTGNATVRLESHATVAAAASLYAAGPANFADCLLAVKSSHAGCEALLTFDRKMRALPGVVAL